MKSKIEVKKKKVSEVNIMVAIATVFVIFIHTSSEAFWYYDKGSLYSIIVYTFNKILSFAVPCFIFMSGFKLSHSKKIISLKDYVCFLKRRIIKIYLPYVLIAAIYIYYLSKHNYINMNITQMIVSILRGDFSSPFYFIVIIMQFYIIFPVFQRIINKKNSWIVLILAIFISMYFKVVVLKSNIEGNILINFYKNQSDRIFISYLAYFVFGSVFSINYEDVKKNIKPSLVIIFYMTALSLHTYLCYINYLGIRYYKYAEVGHMIFCLISIVALWLLAYKMDCKISDKRLHIFKKISAASYYIYLIHVLIMYYVDDYITVHIEKVYISFFVRSLLVIAISFTLAFFINYININISQKKRSSNSLY